MIVKVFGIGRQASEIRNSQGLARASRNKKFEGLGGSKTLFFTASEIKKLVQGLDAQELLTRIVDAEVCTSDF